MSFNTISSDPETTKAAERQMEALLSRSATDWDFRQKLINDPPAALAEFAGREVPASESYRFIENDADVTIVLPEPIREGEISERELEMVSGGSLFEAIAAGIALGLALHALECPNH